MKKHACNREGTGLENKAGLTDLLKNLTNLQLTLRMAGLPTGGAKIWQGCCGAFAEGFGFG